MDEIEVAVMVGWIVVSLVFIAAAGLAWYVRGAGGAADDVDYDGSGVGADKSVATAVRINGGVGSY